MQKKFVNKLYLVFLNSKVLFQKKIGVDLNTACIAIYSGARQAKAASEHGANKAGAEEDTFYLV